MMRILTVGNCQSRMLTKILKSYFKNAHIENILIDMASDQGINFDNWDYVFLQYVGGSFSEDLTEWRKHSNVWLFPNITFRGFQPDYIYLDRVSGKERISNQSSILLNAFFSGLSCHKAALLFNERFISLLDYQSYFDSGKTYLIRHMSDCGMDGEFYFAKWEAEGAFMHTINHPNLMVMVDVVKNLCERAALKYFDFDLTATLSDDLLGSTIFPCYGVKNGSGSQNMLSSENQFYKVGTTFYTLIEFVALSYKLFIQCKDDLRVDEYRMAKFKHALSIHKLETDTKSINPYLSKGKNNFWRDAVAHTSPSELAPLLEQNIKIEKSMKVATAGSCFAQHIARTLSANDLDYYVAEKAPITMPEQKAMELGFNLFSARFGNIYTAKQLLQLFKRAYGQYSPQDDVWVSKSGKYLDAFRPNIGEEFETAQAVCDSRSNHLNCVRDMFENLDVFVFTLGLTECWMNSFDCAVYPVAPGVVSTHESYENYKFKNFNHDEIMKDMIEFLGLLRSVNRSSKVLLTVSPVPLIATYEDEHVLSATTYSKSVLRTVAGELSKAFDFVSYFPSYEIITGSFNKGVYYEDDLRTVKPEGVSHVMGVFMDYLVNHSRQIEKVQAKASQGTEQAMQIEIEKNADIICDEELIENAVR